MENTKKSRQKNKPRKLSPQDFVKQYVEKQKELLQGMVKCIQDGEILLDTDYADDYINSVVDEWCEYTEPDFALNMRMSGAVFLLALLDSLEGYGEDSEHDENDEIDKSDPMNSVGVVIALEVLQTIRDIWGKRERNG
jgi:hypothetical protein